MLKANHGYSHDNNVGGKCAVKCDCGLIHPYDSNGHEEMDIFKHWDETSNQFVTTTKENLPVKKSKAEMLKT